MKNLFALLPPGGQAAELPPSLFNTLLVSSLFKPYKGRVKKAKVQRATGEFTLASLQTFFHPYITFFDFVLTHKSSFTTPERSVHPDVRGALGGRRRLCLQAPGSDASVSQLTDVYGLIAEQHSKCINK